MAKNGAEETYLTPEDVEAIKELQRNFEREVTKLFLQAKRSGAVGNATPFEIGRCVLVIVAENFMPPYLKKLLANLRHFI